MPPPQMINARPLSSSGSVIFGAESLSIGQYTLCYNVTQNKENPVLTFKKNAFKNKRGVCTLYLTFIKKSTFSQFICHNEMKLFPLHVDHRKLD